MERIDCTAWRRIPRRDRTIGETIGARFGGIGMVFMTLNGIAMALTDPESWAGVLDPHFPHG